MQVQNALRYVIAAALAGMTGVIVIYCLDAFQASAQEARLKLIGAVLLALLTGAGSLYALLFRHYSELGKQERQGEIARDNKTIENIQQTAITVVSALAQSYFKEQVEPRLSRLK